MIPLAQCMSPKPLKCSLYGPFSSLHFLCEDMHSASVRCECLFSIGYLVCVHMCGCTAYAGAHRCVCVHVFICVDVPHMQLHTDVCVHVFTCVYALHVQVYSSSTHQVDNRLTITCGICSLTHDPSSFTRITKCIISFKLCRSLG